MPRGEICVLGAGSWGTALANILAKNGSSVILWSIEEDVLREIEKDRVNTKYHPGFRLDEKIRPCFDLATAVKNKKYVLVVLPSHTVRETLGRVKADIEKNAAIITASKGIENTSLKTMTEIMLSEIPDMSRTRLAVLSGPSFAAEVMKALPTAVSVASTNEGLAKEVQSLFHNDKFRTYTTDDVIGVELGGALKNVIAIAVGASDGYGMGHNARAALITRGAAEISRLGIARGANPLTFLGLSGMGDLILTCTSDLSRNRTVGFRIGKGEKLAKILEETGQVVEGIKTAQSAHNLAEKLQVDMPITEQVYKMIYENKDCKNVLIDLTARDPKREIY